MRGNVLQRNDAPGGTRTPNLLIRSQSPTAWMAPAIAFLQRATRTEAATQIPKADDESHNPTHNTTVGVKGRRKGLRQARPCLVYIIHRPDTSEVKIGIAADVQRRFRQLQQANGGELFLLASVPGGLVDEAFAHSRWELLHKRGEWFHSSPELLEWASRVGSRTIGIHPVAADYLTHNTYRGRTREAEAFGVNQ